MAMVQARCPVMIGRDDDLSALEDVLLRCVRGEGRVATIAGEAGIGKTRLASELAVRAKKIGAQIMWGGCTEAELALPYLPFLEAVGTWLFDADVEAVTRRLGPAARELANLFPQLPAEPSAQDSTEAAQAKARLFESLLLLLRIAAEGHGLLVVVEDIHWADASTRELLDYMTRRLRGAPVMVLATYRSDELHRKHPLRPIVQGWTRSRMVDAVDLAHLGPGNVAAVVGAILSEQVSDEFRDFMHDRSEGNPFVIEEMLKEAIDRGDVYRTSSGWDRKAIEDIGIPRSVRDGVLWRVDRLDPEHAGALRAAAVLGTSFAFEWFMALSDLDEPVAARALEACAAEQLIEEDRYARGRYRFRHALTREAVYEDMALSVRQRLHSRAADSLSGRDDVSGMEIAHHLFAAGRTRDAIPVFLEAAEAAQRGGGLLEAIALCERILPHVTDRAERGRILARLGAVSAAAMQITQAIEYLLEAISILDSLGETTEVARCRLALGRAYWQMRRPDLARAEDEAGVRALEPMGPSEDLAVHYARLAAMHSFDLEEAEALALASRAMEVAAEAGSDFARVLAESIVGLAMFGQGDEEQGLARIDAAFEESLAFGMWSVAAPTLWNGTELRLDNGMAEEAAPRVDLWKKFPPHPLDGLTMGFVLADLAFCRGEVREAERLFRSALTLSQSGEWPWMTAWTIARLGRTLVERGKLDEARSLLPPRGEATERQDAEPSLSARIRLHLAAGETGEALEEALVVLDERSIWCRYGLTVCSAAQALIAAGRLEDARSLVEASPLTERHGSYPWLLVARSRVAMADGEPDRAQELLTDAVSRFTETNYGLNVLRARLALAEACAADGDVHRAAGDLAEIATKAGKMGAGLVRSEARALAERLGIAIAVDEEVEGDESVAPVEKAGERLVTVMFADVRGYTAMTNERAPADMIERMTTFYRWARKEIERQGGMVDRYAGDAVMATFNVSEVSVDHAQRALEAGIALQDKAALVDLPVGVGIAVGSAVVGTLTGGDNIDVIGETTNLAARLQAQASPRQTILDEEAHRRVKPWLEERGITAEQRLVELKGFEGKTPVWVVSR